MAQHYREDVKAVLDGMLSALPGVTIGKAFGYPAYKMGRKMFAFVGGAGIAIKLPEARVQELIAAHEAMSAFSPDGVAVWREWLSIDHEDAQDFRQHEALYEATGVDFHSTSRAK